MIAHPYAAEGRHEWDDFVGRSKNGTFLFRRDYMEYHADRFVDASLVVRDDDGSVAALLPAHRVGDEVVSHGGLSFGGLVTSADMKVPRMLDVMTAVLARLRTDEARALVYKAVPAIYHHLPADEDLYALFLCDAVLRRRSALAVVGRDARGSTQERRRRGARKAQRAGVRVAESADLAGYWTLLTNVLAAQHDARPVHSLEEMQRLRDAFPAEIRLFAATRDDALLAGVLVYRSARVAHAQYIAAGDEGRALGALDLLFAELLDVHFADIPWFDFGSSDEHGGRTLNRGLIDQKEGFGARAVAQDTYVVDVAAASAIDITRAMR